MRRPRGGAPSGGATSAGRDAGADLETLAGLGTATGGGTTGLGTATGGGTTGRDPVVGHGTALGGDTAPGRRTDAGGGSPAPAGDRASASPLLQHDECDKFGARLREAVTGFVDGPRDAVEEADRVVEELASRFADAVTRRRRTLRASWQTADDGRSAATADTEQLRLVLRDYRELADRLLRRSTARPYRSTDRRTTPPPSGPPAAHATPVRPLRRRTA
ncbi:hypothetical protein ABZV31_01405 [Streptomyces sp. NPDC005202]|uniref:hypothetical protein n=1 Tax=Streptomyces sp. NPDC005202 TaxID=3157021 RepID=UPI0033AAB8A1